MLTKGISASPVTGVLEVEFWNERRHSGSLVWKKSTKWLRTAVEPGLPGTRGRRIGARSLPVWMLKSSPGPGMACRVSSERVEYALTRQIIPKTHKK